MVADKDFLDLLNNEFNIRRNIRVGDSVGGFDRDFKDIAVLMGRVSPKSSSERVWNMKYDAYVTHVLYIEVVPNKIRRGDLVEGIGKRFRVLGVREPVHRGHHLEVDIEEIQLKLFVICHGVANEFSRVDVNLYV